MSYVKISHCTKHVLLGKSHMRLVRSFTSPATAALTVYIFLGTKFFVFCTQQLWCQQIE